MLHKQNFAINFVATPFLGGGFFSDATQAKDCHIFCGNSIFGRKFFSVLHKQNFAINFEATPFLGGSFFSDATQAKVCHKFCGNSIFGRKLFFFYTSK